MPLTDFLAAATAAVASRKAEPISEVKDR